jgi:CDP-diacylglycerol--glycerol-3-phosphate 3-phosphatidyltransferase
MPKTSFISREETDFQKAEKLVWYDKIMARTILKLIPNYVKPNYITAFRFITTPVVVLLMFFGNYSVGLIAFILVAFTDTIDGSLARTRDQITEWGKVYDPLADKVLIGSMVFTIVLRYIDLWTALMIIFIEFVIIITAWIRKQKGAIIQANIWGKIKMNLQVAGVSILLLAIVFDWAALFPFASGTFYLAIAFAIVSLLTYGI